MRQVHAGVSKADAGIRCRQQHLAARLPIVRVLNCAHDVGGHHLNRLAAPNVTDGIGSLIGRPQLWCSRCGALVIRQRCQGFQGMRQHIQPGTGSHQLGQCARVIRIQNSKIGAQRAVGNSGLGVHLGEVKDGDACGLTAGASCGGHSNQRLQRAGHRLAPANGRVHVCQQISRIGCVQVGRLGRVNHRPAAHRQVAVKLAAAGKLNRL